MKRVVVTGLGTVNPLGNDVETSFSRMLAGESGVGPLTSFDTSDYPVHFAGSVKWEPSAHFRGPDLRKLDPFTMFALVATREALADAGLQPAQLPESERERFPVLTEAEHFRRAIRKVMAQRKD